MRDLTELTARLANERTSLAGELDRPRSPILAAELAYLACRAVDALATEWAMAERNAPAPTMAERARFRHDHGGRDPADWRDYLRQLTHNISRIFLAQLLQADPDYPVGELAELEVRIVQRREATREGADHA